jgi:5'-nucleotidase
VGRRRRARILAGLVVVLAAVGGCSSSGAPAAAPAAPRPLRILVTNDDGWSAPGIAAVRDALRRAGNTVVEVAPAQDQSGTGSALTLTSPLTLARPTADPDVWAVGGRPADATSVGLRTVLAAAPPDLVVSGINTGNNVTASAFHSGTIGAAMTAAETGVPAIAVSGPTTKGGDTSPEQYAAAADYTARLVSAISARPAGGRLLPAGMVLNVNYPRVAPGGKATGVVAAPTADQAGIAVSYAPAPDGSLVPRVAQAAPLGGADDASVVARGQVALTDLAADPEAPSASYGVAAGLAPAVQP